MLCVAQDLGPVMYSLLKNEFYRFDQKLTAVLISKDGIFRCSKRQILRLTLNGGKKKKINLDLYF